MTVGILGGGQLGLMLGESLDRLGEDWRVYDPDPLAPTTTRWPERATTAGWDNLKALAQFFEGCDVITYESENVLTAPFHALGVSEQVLPPLPVLETVQDRIREKTFLSSNALSHVAYRALKDIADLPEIAADFGFPFIVKSARGGYDGKGQYRVNTPSDIDTLPPLREGISGWWIIEEVVDIALEVSCIVGRGQGGEEVCFPLFENIHRNHILDFTTVPARVPEPLAKAIQETALEAARTMKVTGLLTVEFFITRNQGRHGSLHRFEDYFFAVNEFAPRPHNSGHVTRAATQVSQFDLLAQILTKRPLEEPRLSEEKRYCMGQLLGEVWLEQGDDNRLKTQSVDGDEDVVEVFDYGKAVVRPQRKMGHYIVHADTIELALSRAEEVRKTLSDDRG